MSLRRNSWLSLTPEPERELPPALAALRTGPEPSREAILRERIRAERMVVGGSRRRWIHWMREARRLSERGHGDPRLETARQIVLDVLDNHHALALGLPGRANRATEAERLRVAQLRRRWPGSVDGGRR